MRHTHVMYTVVNKLDVECQQALIHCRELEDKGRYTRHPLGDFCFFLQGL